MVNPGAQEKVSKCFETSWRQERVFAAATVTDGLPLPEIVMNVMPC
jgi:hypothetical protein